MGFKKAVLKGRVIAIQAYLKKQEKNQINNLALHLKQLEKEEMKNPRISRRKEIRKFRAEINENIFISFQNIQATPTAQLQKTK